MPFLRLKVETFPISRGCQLEDRDPDSFFANGFKTESTPVDLLIEIDEESEIIWVKVDSGVTYSDPQASEVAKFVNFVNCGSNDGFCVMDVADKAFRFRTIQHLDAVVVDDEFLSEFFDNLCAEFVAYVNFILLITDKGETSDSAIQAFEQMRDGLDQSPGLN
jgi:hypothetical protein